MKQFLSILILSILVAHPILSQEDHVVPGEIIVMLKPGVSTSALETPLSSFGLKAKEVLVADLNIWLFEYNAAMFNPVYVLSQVRSSNVVSIAQFNHYVTQRSLTPNDTRFGEQWSMNNTGQTGGTPDADIDGPEAWGITTGGLTAMGDSIVVAIVDGGFYLTHADIKFWKNYADIPGNGIDDDGNGYIDDFNGWNAVSNNGNITGDTHGSHCSGIAGATGNNSLGVCGVNWGVKIMPIMGSSSVESVVIRAYGYALKERTLYNQTNGTQGAFVVSTNSSFGVDYGQPANYPLWCAFYDSLGNAGILSACATANLNINIDVQGDIPTACPSPYMVAVTNTTNTDAKNSGAAYGLITIDLGAPGTSILSTTTSGNYGLLTGTSMATPHVAGAIALIISAGSPQFIQAYKNRPDSIALIVKSILLQGVDPKPSLQGITVSGGRLNVYNSVLLIQNLTAFQNNSEIVPKFYRLYQNYPNPFNPSTVINYDVPEDGIANLSVYDITGKLVSVVFEGQLKAGVHASVWNAKAFASGIYYYKFESNGFSETKKMVLVK